MKNSELISVVLLFYSCDNRDISRALSQSEDIMSSRPDSALAIIARIDTTKLVGRPQRARYALLMSMALDKNYIDVANDSLASVAFNYYKIHGSSQSKMLSYYYLGVVRQNAGNFLQAAIDFDSALSLAKELEDYHYCGLSCRHLTTLNAYNYNHVLALKFARMATEYFDMCGETLSADYGRINEAGELIRNYRYDDALVVIESVIRTNDYPPLLKLAYLLQAEALLYGKRDYIGAEMSLTHVPISNSPTDKLIQYGYYAYLYELKGETQNANRFIALARPLISTPNDSLSFLDQVSRIHRMRGNYMAAYDDVSRAMEIQNRQITSLLGQSVTYTLEQHYRQLLHDEKGYSHRKTLIIAFILAISVIAASLLLYVIWRMRRERVQDMAEIDTLNHDLHSLMSRNEHFRKVTDSIIQERIQFLKQLANSYFDWTDEEVRKREKAYGLQTKEEIITAFRKQLSELRSDKRLLSSIEQAINYSKDGLMETMRRICVNDLKESDFIILTLLLSGLTIKSVAFLLRMSEPSLRTRKTRYKHYFQTLQEPYASC